MLWLSPGEVASKLLARKHVITRCRHGLQLGATEPRISAARTTDPTALAHTISRTSVSLMFEEIVMSASLSWC